VNALNDSPGPVRSRERMDKWQKCMTLLIIASLFVSLGLLASLAFAQQSITVYTVSGQSVAIPKNQESITRVIELDRILKIEAALEAGLAKLDPETAVQTARNRLTVHHQRELVLAWQALFRVQSGEITHLPAIVFDDRAVWYGIQFRRALRAWRAQRQ